jgi:hypothetical protein
LLGHFDELAVVESLRFEGLDLCVDQGHGVSFGGWLIKKNYQMRNLIGINVSGIGRLGD